MNQIQAQEKRKADKEYLNGLQIQTKNRYFPQIGAKEEGKNLNVPKSSLVTSAIIPAHYGSEKRDRVPKFSYIQSEVPYAGSWFKQ